jgi:ferrochelatase
MLHLKPYIADVIKKRLDQGIEMFVVVSLAPFHSRVSTGAYFQTARELFDRVVNNNIEVVYISNWRNNSYYIEAMAEGINKSLDAFFSSVKEEVNIIFSVHSLPLEFIEQGDPYVDEVELTIELLLPRLHSTNWYLAFQSKGRGENWLKPDVETVLQSISKKQVKDVLIVPLGFVSDHVETLYDIDILYQEFSRKIGINLKRCPALNDSALFIKALADEVRKNTEHWRRG